MNVLIVANSLIIKESISNIFKKVYNGSNIKITNKIDNLSIDEINFYDMILVNIVKNDLNFFNKVIQLKNNKNKIVILDQLKNDKVLKLCIEKNIVGM